MREASSFERYPTMPWAPVCVVGALVALTICLTEYAGWDPMVAGLAVGAGLLAITAIVAGVTLLFLPADERARFRAAIFDTAKKDLTDIRDQMTFRR